MILPTKLTQAFGRAGLLARKHSPEILVGAGILTFIATVVLSSKATLKAPDIIKDTKKKIKKVKTNEITEYYTTDLQTADLARVYVESGIEFAKLYAPTIGMGTLSIAMILSGHGILHRRNLAVMAGYNILQESYTRYRQRVVDELGANVDRAYHLGIQDEEEDPKKTKKNKKEAGENVEYVLNKSNQPSIYAKFFDQLSPYWQNESSLNLYFLKARQNFANDKFKAQGHLFLNEVYDDLGIPRTQEGTVVGWVWDKDKGGDNYIDFGIYNPRNQPATEFVNGYNDSILLDFNVDGLIWNKI